MFTFCDGLHEANQKRKQTFESALLQVLYYMYNNNSNDKLKKP